MFNLDEEKIENSHLAPELWYFCSARKPRISNRAWNAYIH